MLANDTDAEGNPLTAIAVSPPANAALFILNADGSFSYSPAPDFNGIDSFTYTVSDGSLDSNTATVTITVNAVNDAPVITSNGGGVQAAITVPENTTDVTTVAANDVDGNPLAFSIAPGFDAARFAIDPITHVVRFLAAPDFENPTDAEGDNAYDVVVLVEDGQGSFDQQLLRVFVTNVNDRVGVPIAAYDSYATTEDIPLNIAPPGVLANDTDAEGNGLAIIDFSPPANAAFNLEPDGSFTYTPAPDFNGVDSFTYTVVDGSGDLSTGTVIISVIPVNDFARAGHTATLLSSGKVLVAGGSNGISWLSSAKLYDPETGTWSETGSLGTERREHTATLLPFGKVLVVGGSNRSGSLSSAELYDPETRNWFPEISLVTARAGHTATLLPFGKVLVAGGDIISGALSSAEIFGALDAIGSPRYRSRWAHRDTAALRQSGGRPAQNSMIRRVGRGRRRATSLPHAVGTPRRCSPRA